MTPVNVGPVIEVIRQYLGLRNRQKAVQPDHWPKSYVATEAYKQREDAKNAFYTSLLDVVKSKNHV